MKAYYARPMSLYGTPQETRDIDAIKSMGYEVVDFTPEVQAAVKDLKEAGKDPMKVFHDLVDTTTVLFFRSFLDGKIGAGVASEIRRASEIGIPIFEMPRTLRTRVLSIEETRDYLRELFR